MRILMLTGHHKADEVMQLAAGLREAGTQVTVVKVLFVPALEWFAVATERTETANGTDITVTISGRAHRWIQKRYTLLLYVLRNRAQLVLPTDTDVIHAFGLHPVGAIGQRLAKRMNVPFILSPLSSELLNGLAHLPHVKWRSAAVAGAHTVVVEAEVLRHKALNSQRIEVVAPTITSGPFQFRPRAMGSGLYFVMAGRWDDEQPVIARPKLALKALAEVEQQLGRPVTLGIIGDGDRLPELKEYCTRLGIHVQCFGELSDAALAREFQKADLFLHPTDFAIFPNRMVQAMLCGVPVLASDVEGMVHFLGEAQYGLLTENKFSAWKEALLLAVGTDFDHRAIATHTAGRFGKERMVEAMSGVYGRARG
jgi:glycosyltransferase involved in cell wall biosynthesis